MKYLCLLGGSPEDVGPQPGSAEFGRMLADYQTVTEAMAAAGVLVDSGPLQPSSMATTVRVRNGETLMTDGPFAEMKEQIGGYYTLDCADLDAALGWAAQIPAARYGAVEVRPILELSGM